MASASETYLNNPLPESSPHFQDIKVHGQLVFLRAQRQRSNGSVYCSHDKGKCSDQGNPTTIHLIQQGTGIPYDKPAFECGSKNGCEKYIPLD